MANLFDFWTRLRRMIGLVIDREVEQRKGRERRYARRLCAAGEPLLSAFSPLMGRWRVPFGRAPSLERLS